ncbi:MAG: universal stress protein [Planctomycetota bacterium]
MRRHLLILDGSEAAEHAIPHAVAAARTFEADLRLLHVLECETPSAQHAVDPVDWRMRHAQAGAYLEAWRGRLAAQGVPVTTELREGRPAEQILDVVRALGIDLVVLAPHGAGGPSTSGLGDVAGKLLAAGGVSFLLARRAAPDAASDVAARYTRILVPLDASRRAECALPVASAMARAHAATLLLAHVAPVPELPGAMPPAADDVRLRERVVTRNRECGAAYLDAVRARAASPDLPVTTRILVASDVGRALCRSASEEQVDLVVTSAHGGGCRGTGAFAPYGSVARELIADRATSLWILQDLPAAPAVDAAAAYGAAFVGPRAERTAPA